MQAGLGGGSSNAATALWSFVKLTGLPISQEALLSWGAELGSDVPFFFSSGSAMASGRGELLTDVTPYLSSSFWIVKPKEGLSTAEVYRFCRPNLQKKEEEVFYNDLEEAAFFLAPSLLKIKKALLSFGFKTVVLSGSGTAFFCLEDESRSSLEELKQKFPDLQFFSVKPLQKKHLEWYE
jgi:4-diphosphocytidyl-2-C-methyl-D-erythritol kinase